MSTDESLTNDSILKHADIVLSPAQILALRATPVEIIQAPGWKEFLFPVGMVCALKFATTPYVIANDNDLALTYANGVTQIDAVSILGIGFLDFATDTSRYAAPGFFPSVEASGQMRLMVRMLGAAEVEDGDSEIRLRLFYRRIPTLLY
jgi:hypothetical protein